MPVNNPFRHRDEVAPPSPPLPPLPQSPDASSSSRPPPEHFDDDLPPPYTPAPNVSIGEETVGLGPRRPFQQPPPLPPPSSQPYAQSPYSRWPPPSAQAYQPPPIMAPWQTQQQYYRQRQNGGGGLLGALIDTIRDIGDTVSGTADQRMMGLRRANAGAYATPYATTGTVYAPPPGPPAPIHHTPPPPRPASTPPTNSAPTMPDDGTPTRTPVPGHPLLRRGQLLVYPKDYLCVKCKNTGYKNYDPSSPCHKCWEKYAKPYTGALSYSPWSSSGNDPRMQRALPKLVPPHLAGGAGLSSSSAYATPSSFAPPPQHPHTRSVSQPHHTRSSSEGPSYYVVNPLCPHEGAPPVPDAIAVSPGDQRLGGRLCPRCGGEGIRIVMLIDFDACDTCGGTGRVWR